MQRATGPGHGGREGKAQGVHFRVADDAPGAKDAPGADGASGAADEATAAVAAAGAPTASVEAAASVADAFVFWRAVDDAASAASSRSVRTTLWGDSEHTDPDQEDAGDFAAVAAGGGAPTRDQSRRERPARDTTPQPRTLGPGRVAGVQNEGDHAGNVGYIFGNYGRMPASPDQRRDLERQIKRSPAMIVGLAECEEITAVLLQQPGEPKPAVADVPPGFEKRESYEYLTIRGSEEISVLIGLRANTGNDLSLVFWERRFEGTYKKKKRFHDAYTRVLVAKVTLDHPAPVIGRVHNVMVMHLHHHLANNNWPDRLKAFWGWLEQKLRQYNVKVLMGDFNMQSRSGHRPGCVVPVEGEGRRRGHG